MPNIMSYVFLTLGFLIVVSFAIKLGRNIFSPVTVTKATVVHKQTVETFSQYSGTGKHTKYAVTFSVNGKNRSFYVSAFSYNGYRKGDTGTITYKADKLISFT